MKGLLILAGYTIGKRNGSSQLSLLFTLDAYKYDDSSQKITFVSRTQFGSSIFRDRFTLQQLEVTDDDYVVIVSEGFTCRFRIVHGQAIKLVDYAAIPEGMTAARYDTALKSVAGMHADSLAVIDWETGKFEYLAIDLSSERELSYVRSRFDALKDYMHEDYSPIRSEPKTNKEFIRYTANFDGWFDEKASKNSTMT